MGYFRVYFVRSELLDFLGGGVSCGVGYMCEVCRRGPEMHESFKMGKESKRIPETLSPAKDTSEETS